MIDPKVEEYFEAVPDSRKERVQRLHRLIVERFPQASVDMRYKMPSYKYGEGWVAIANQKNYISLYTCSAEYLKVFKLKHPSIKTGTGCINFRHKDELVDDDIRQVIEHAMLEPKAH